MNITAARFSDRWPGTRQQRAVPWWRVLETIQKALIGRQGGLGLKDYTVWKEGGGSHLYTLKKNFETKYSSELPPGSWEFTVKSGELRVHYEPPEDMDELRSVSGFDDHMVDCFTHFQDALARNDKEAANEYYRAYYSYMHSLQRR